MIKAKNIEDLFGTINQLFVEVICPKCGNTYITTMLQGKSILAFGCIDCGDIEESTLLKMNSLHNEEATECTNS